MREWAELLTPYVCVTNSDSLPKSVVWEERGTSQAEIWQTRPQPRDQGQPQRWWYMPVIHLIRRLRYLCGLPPHNPNLTMRKVKSESVSHSAAPTLCDLVDYSLPGSSVHGNLQARRLEWVAMPFSRGSSWLRDRTQVSYTAGRFFTTEPPGKQLLLTGCHFSYELLF